MKLLAGPTAREHADLYDSAERSVSIRGALSDLVKYRALIRLLVARDLTVRYKRSLLGVSWTVLNPLLTTLVMWVVFNHLFRFQIPGNIPYLVYLLSGILAVTYFQQGISMTAASMVASAGVLTKVYVPPMVFAMSAACGGALNFIFGLVPLVIFQLVLGVGVAWSIVLVPLPLICLLAMIAGLGLILTTLAVRFDDVLNLVNVLLVLVGYLTPTFFPLSIVPITYRHLFYLNPLVSYVEIFRFFEYGGPPPNVLTFAVVGTSALVSLLAGIAIFVRRWPSLIVLL